MPNPLFVDVTCTIEDKNQMRKGAFKKRCGKGLNLESNNELGKSAIHGQTRVCLEIITYKF
jgi:hypothetical protein